LLKNDLKKFITLDYTQKVTKLDQDVFKMMNEDDSMQLEEFKFKMVNAFVLKSSVESFETVLGEKCLFLITIELKSNEYKSVLTQFQNGVLEIDLHLSAISFNNNENNKSVELFKQDFPIKLDFYQNFHDRSKPKSFF
jgi:hypothetical protein